MKNDTPMPTSALTPVPTVESSATPVLDAVTLYVPHANKTALATKLVQAEDSPQGLLSALVTAGALPDVDYGRNISFFVGDETLNIGEETVSGVFVHLDLSDAFGRAIQQSDANGERFMLQNLVNTFLTHYNADALFLTLEGTVLETRHGMYDDSITFDELIQTIDE